MWICSRCQTANKDGYNQCIQCSAPRNARRFGAGTPVSAPNVQAAPPEGRAYPIEQEAMPAPRRSLPPAVKTSPASQAGGRFVRLIGFLLSVLLPVIVILFSIIRFDAVMPFIRSLFFKPEAAILPIFDYLAYGFSALITVLLSLLPGLSLWALGRLIRNNHQ